MDRIDAVRRKSLDTRQSVSRTMAVSSCANLVFVTFLTRVYLRMERWGSPRRSKEFPRVKQQPTSHL